MTKSKKTSKTCQKFDFGMEPKIQHFFQHASRSLLSIWFVAVAFRRRSFLKKGTPRDLFFWRRSRKCENFTDGRTDDG